MSKSTKGQSGDSALGMDQDISRRDFINATLLASGSTLLGGLTPYQALAQMGESNWTGYGGVGDYAQSNGNTYEVITAGHQIRDLVFANPPRDAVDTGEVFDFVVVGGGLSGLAAAHYCRQKAPQAKCLVLENHPIFGGEAKQNEFIVDGRRLVANQGSDHFSTPRPGTPVADLYASIGVLAPNFEYQSWEGPSPAGGAEAARARRHHHGTAHDAEARVEPGHDPKVPHSRPGRRPGHWSGCAFRLRLRFRRRGVRRGGTEQRARRH